MTATGFSGAAIRLVLDQVSQLQFVKEVVRSLRENYPSWMEIGRLLFNELSFLQLIESVLESNSFYLIKVEPR